MFNSTTMRLGDTTNNLTLIQPSTGMMQKSNPKSKFVRFQKGSDMEENVFPSDGQQSFIQKKDNSYNYNKYIDIPIEVIQILVFGENYFLVEYICCSDLEIEDETK